MSEESRARIRRLLRPSDDPSWLEELRREEHDTLLSVLTEIVGDEQQAHGLRGRAIIALSHLKSPRAVTVLTATLNEKDPVLRAWAAMALGETGEAPPRVLDGLLALLSDQDSYIRRRAAEALGRLRAEKALPRLREMAQEDKEELNRRTAKGAIEEIQHIS